VEKQPAEIDKGCREKGGLMQFPELLEKVFAGEPRAIARAITRIENSSDDSAEMMKALYARTGKAAVIGITGSPGAGKSSLVDKLALLYKDQGQKIGIICIDPSSPFSGGAILGDRIRMSTLGTNKNIFIRSMATRGNLGGLSRATVDAVAVLDAAGYDKVIVETVGVGQDEVEIVKTADVSVVVLVWRLATFLLSTRLTAKVCCERRKNWRHYWASRIARTCGIHRSLKLLQPKAKG
jgi:putative protein kinase ArgK-like GTPase of G3E family